MRGPELRVDTCPSAPKTNMIPVSLDTRSQGKLPGADRLSNHNGYHHPPSFSQYQRQMSQTQATMSYYNQHPSLAVPQPARHTVQMNVTPNRNAQRPPVSVPQYQQYLAQFEAAAKHHGQGPSPPDPSSKTGMGHWVRNMPKAHPAYAVRHGNQHTCLNGQPHQPTSNYLVQEHNRTENHNCTLINRSNSSGSHPGPQFARVSQPIKSVDDHRNAGPAQDMTSDPRGLQVHRAVSVIESNPAMDMRERQAMTAGLKRLETLERSFVDLRDDHTRRLLAIERKHEEALAASRANELARYRDVHGLPSAEFREEIGASAVKKVAQAHISIQSSRLSCERNTHKLDGMVTTSLTRTDKSNAPSHDIDSVRDIIEPRSNVDNKNVTPHHEVQARKASKVSVGNVRQRSNGESLRPHAGRYNMRKRVHGRVQKVATQEM